MEIDSNTIDDIKTIISRQNAELLRMICKKYHWNYNDTYDELFSK
jgi:hypothetical protein